jgi:hypothetical protein
MSVIIVFFITCYGLVLLNRTFNKIMQSHLEKEKNKTSQVAQQAEEFESMKAELLALKGEVNLMKNVEQLHSKQILTIGEQSNRHSELLQVFYNKFNQMEEQQEKSKKKEEGLLALVDELTSVVDELGSIVKEQSVNMEELQNMYYDLKMQMEQEKKDRDALVQDMVIFYQLMSSPELHPTKVRITTRASDEWLSTDAYTLIDYFIRQFGPALNVKIIEKNGRLNKELASQLETEEYGRVRQMIKEIQTMYTEDFEPMQYVKPNGVNQAPQDVLQRQQFEDSLIQRVFKTYFNM